MKSKIVFGMIIIAVIAIAYMEVQSQGLLVSKEASGYGTIVNLLGVAISAFFGATGAFFLESSRQKKLVDQVNINSLRTALLTQALQLDALYNTKKVFDSYNNVDARVIFFPAYQPADYSELKVDVNSILFVGLHAEPMLLINLMNSQVNFEQAYVAANYNKDFRINTLYPLLKEKGLLEKEVKLSVEEWEREIGEQVYNEAKKILDTFEKHLVLSIDTLQKQHHKLYKVSNELYANAKFPFLEKNTS